MKITLETMRSAVQLLGPRVILIIDVMASDAGYARIALFAQPANHPKAQ